MARFLPKTISLFSVHFVLSEKGISRRIATYRPIASLLSFFCAQGAGKKDFILGHLSKRNSFAFLHNMPSKNLQPLCAVISKVYFLSGHKPALTRHFKAAISRHTKLQKARPFFFGPAFSLQPYFSRQIKERRADALRSVPSHKGCYTVGGVQSKKIDWKG